MIEEKMINSEDIDYMALSNPDDRFFKVFKCENTPEFYYKINKFKKFLMEKYLYTSDEHRSQEMVERGIANMLMGSNMCFLYEIGDFQGLIIFANIIPNHKADVIFKIWDKKMFSKDFVRACNKLANLVMDNLQLKRLTSHSADPKMTRFATMAGFKEEGKSPCSMKWDGKLYDNYTLGLVREV